MDLAVVASCAAWVALAVASHTSPHVPVSLYLAGMAVAWSATLVSWICAATLPWRYVAIRVWTGAVIFRLAGLAADPVFEDDYFRYLWDGWMFAHTGNPFGVTPAAFFESPVVPDALVGVLNGINHPDLPTVYGPTAQWIFRLGYAVAPAALWPVKLALVSAELATLWLLTRRIDIRHALLFAWCPLLVHETAFNAHPEALGVLAVVAALAATEARRPVAAGVALGLAAGVKPLGALWAPFVFGWRDVRAWGALAATTVLLWTPFVMDGRAGVAAGFTAFAGSWEFNSSLFGLIAAAVGHSGARVACGLAMLAGYGWLVWWMRKPRGHATPEVGTAGQWLYGGVLLLSPVVNPWYLAWLMPFVAMRPTAVGLAAAVSVSVSYLTGLNLSDDTLSLYGHPAWVRPLEYGVVAAAGLALALRSRARAWTLALNEPEPLRPGVAGGAAD